MTHRSGSARKKAGGAQPGARRRAAMYVRMSTEHQQYSIENQTAAMERYAENKAMDIVQTYTDGGKSGVRIEGRAAMKQMLADVKAETKEFSDILVLDVSRWGRFQDPDEAACYEFLCRSAGYDVHYVNEPFANDRSIWATMAKNMKRNMAGEYSREMSDKVFAGQCRLIEKGFKQGGFAGYGLRRMLIDEQRRPKYLLKRGEHKALQTDRVILVPGPAEEIEIVRWIYKSFVNDRLMEREIARRLNARGILTDLGRAWTRGVVHGILTNEKYIGNNVFNRRSFKLKKERVVNAPEEWVRADAAFERIVELGDFYAAQGIIGERSRRMSDDDMLSRLKILQERQGWLSGIVIDEAEDMPSSSAYQSRFGSLIRAYKLIGYTPEHDYSFIEINRRLRQLHGEIIKDVIAQIAALGGQLRPDKASSLLVLNEELKLSIVISRARRAGENRLQWKICLDAGLEPDLTLIVRMDAANGKPLDYYLLPALDVENPHFRLFETNGLALDAYRFDTLERFFMLAERAPVPEDA